MENNSGHFGTQQVIEFANFRLNPQQRSLATKDGRLLALHSRAFDTLMFLVSHRGEVVSKNQLLNTIWPNVIVEDNNLNQAISQLRKALGDSAGKNRIILTVPGRGFCFVAEINHLTIDNFHNDHTPPAVLVTKQQPSIPEPASPISLPVHEHDLNFATRVVVKPAPVRPARPIWRTVGMAGLLTVLFAGIAFSTYFSAWSGNVGAPAQPRIAVMMFDNQSPDPDTAFFAEGLHSEIVTTLANRVPGLQVVSRTTMRMYQNSGKSSRTIAAELEATHILEGAVLRDENRMRLTLQLIDGRSDELLWSERYERTLADALQLQADVAGAIANLLLVELAGVVDSPTSDPVAYDLYLKARLARLRLNGSFPVEEWRRAETLLGEAIERDPQFWRAYVERANIRNFIEQNVYAGAAGSAALATGDIVAARSIAGDDPAILAYEASAEANPEEALRLFEIAEARGLSEPELLWAKAGILIRTKRWTEALALYERLATLDAGNIASINIAWGHFLYARDADKSYRLMNGLYQREPDNFQWRMQRAQNIFMFTGDTDEWRAFPFVNTSAFMDEGTRSFEVWKKFRYGGRFSELATYINGLSADAIRNVQIGPFIVFSIAETPVAQFSGWTHFLLGNADDAANDGRAIFNYVARRQPTSADAWYLRLLTAQAHLFTGDSTSAIAATREGLVLAENSNDDKILAAARTEASPILAWADAGDEAVTLLELLADGVPGLPPALITRDPLFNIPLAENPRYIRLRDRLEAGMAAQRYE